MTNNGKPPYTFHYWRYCAPYDEEYATLAEAVCAWSSGEDYGHLSGAEITDADGWVAVSKEQWRELWHTCDDGTLESVLADPDWREKIAKKQIEKAEGAQRLTTERLLGEQQQMQTWMEWMKQASKKTGVAYTLRVDAPRYDWSNGIDPFAMHIYGYGKPYIVVGKQQMSLWDGTTYEDIYSFMMGNRQDHLTR